jgi:hypothetical protein
MPTTAFITYDPAGSRVEPFYKEREAPQQHWKLADGTYAAGTVLGKVTATPGQLKAYADANSDGSGVAAGILRDACVVASGVITVRDEHGGGVVQSVPVYYGGVFKTSELTGLDAAAVADLGGKLISGTVADGLIEF